MTPCHNVCLCFPLQSVGPMHSERFVTSYSRDYKPFRVNQLQSSWEAAAAPALISPPQSRRETWPVFHHYFYKTTNSIYGSTSCPQPPSCSLFPGSWHPLCTPAPYMSEASAFVGSSPTEARTQEVGVGREIGPLLGEEMEGHLHDAFGGKANMLEQQEAKDEPQRKIDVLYEESVIVLSHGGPACCEDLLKSVCREAGLLHLPVASSPIITTKDAGNWDVSAYLRGLEPAIGLKNSTFIQPTSSCAQETACPHGCCLRMKTFPPCLLQSSTLPLAQLQPTFYCPEPSRSTPLTEYQARYTAEPKMQQSVIHHRHPHHETLYSSF
ncbi:uncharacterized protein LOC130211538 isoform X2 [Pseudoliparis swirei]|uniref:uncharacterized protein LOC130211538 isoform X2 n=1 Tax=Pseudoliparis swirei TaxID=2059687 RepID=UPI0024BE90AC|nr:uncharacterized protein LOC130211538 isoform X2 [Pseudoliparis swirei]